jgi:hypothetical protein
LHFNYQSIIEQHNGILLLEYTENLTSKIPRLFTENHFFCYQNSLPVFSHVTPRSPSLNITMKCRRTFLLIRSRSSANKGFIKAAHYSKSDQTVMSMIRLNKTTESRGRAVNTPASQGEAAADCSVVLRSLFSHYRKCRDGILNRPRWLPSMLFPTHHSHITQQNSTLHNQCS